MIISLFLDGVFSLVNNIIPLFTLTFLIFENNYKKPNINKVFIIGLLYDLIYTNTLVMNAIIFVVFSSFLNKKKSFIELVLYNIFIITIYITFINMFFHIYNYVEFNIDVILYIKAILTNTIYLIILYILKHIIKW